MQLLMLSSSKEGRSGFLETARPIIIRHLQDIDKLLFIPYAGVTLDWDEYTQKVQQALPEIKVTGIHQHKDPVAAITQANAIATGGGNTFNLLNELYRHKLIAPIQQQVKNGVPYIGWSAGANICGNSIRTTNDMPIVAPPSFDALNLVPFQINPHYSDYQPPGFNGETRAQRLAEFMRLEPAMPVVAIREGGALLRDKDILTLIGPHTGVLFKGGEQQEIQSGQDLSWLLES
ncbi:dipeptidase PepE [Lacimicrobium alkaliphilum]|uniref:Peptidase E n=1 Tax=Lacimicrobium alkaliphilum TaxID=1526571 RepID=A0A0U2ZHT6_9ALTE|nr:dipeptidase PepE [Lacimicrobium alkaliphilum]ALS98535.1 peptidase E [Lacimicrobium alkaliphilum]